MFFSQKGRGLASQGARGHGSAGYRRLDNAPNRNGQHERAHHHDSGEGRRHDQGRLEEVLRKFLPPPPRPAAESSFSGDETQAEEKKDHQVEIRAGSHRQRFLGVVGLQLLQ